MTFKFTINIRTGDVEFEGTEEFVKEQISNLPDTIKSIAEHLPPPAVSTATSPGPSNSPPQAEMGASPGGSNEVPDSFGEWIHYFPDDISDQDKALLAGLFVQKSSDTNDFKTAEINSVLKEHGFKLSNASDSLKSLVSKKLLFQTRKEGSLKFLRVSKPGEVRIAELRGTDN